jgi:hypothetical protein
VRFAAPKNSAPLTALGRGKHALRLGRKSKNKKTSSSCLHRHSRGGFVLYSPFSIKILRQDALGTTIANSVNP